MSNEDTLVTRSCYNPNCEWEGMIESYIRMCPGTDKDGEPCEWELKGWKPGEKKESKSPYCETKGI